MEDKLQILEKCYQDTGLTLHKDVLRCKSLLAEFVQQISEASELLSLDVVYGESPKFDWLKECLQKRIEVKFFDERNESDLLRGDQNQVNESQTGQITHPDYSQENVAENCYTDEEYDSVMMSDKCIQTTPIQRNRSLNSKKNLLKFLQESNILKKCDSVCFMNDKSYDADVSQVKTDLSCADITSSTNDLTYYPNSSYDTVSPSKTKAATSDVSRISSDVQHMDGNSTVNGSAVSMEPSMFRKVHTRRQSMVTFMLPNNTSKGDIIESDGSANLSLGVADLSKITKSSETSVYQSISLMANEETSLNCSSGSDAHFRSALIHHSIDVTKRDEEGEEVLRFEVPGVAVGPAESDHEFSQAELSLDQNASGIEKETPVTKLTVVSDNFDGQKLKTEVSQCGDILETRDESVLEREEQMVVTHYTLVKGSMPRVSHQHQSDESMSGEQEEQDFAISSDNNDNDDLQNDMIDVKGRLADENTTRIKVRRKRRRGPPLNMPRGWKGPRKEFIKLFNETKSKNLTANKIMNPVNTFRKEPLSAKLKQAKEMSLQSGVSGTVAAQKGVMPKRRSPLFLSASKGKEDICNTKLDNGEDLGGFAIVKRIIWTPEASHQSIADRSDRKNRSKYFIVDEDEGISDKEMGASACSSVLSPEDEMLMSIKARPKRTRRKNPYTVDLELEITMQPDTKNERNDNVKAGNNRLVSVRIKDGKVRKGKSTKVKRSMLNCNDSSVLNEKDPPIKEELKATNDVDLHDVLVAGNNVLRMRRSKRGRRKRKDLPGDYESIRTASASETETVTDWTEIVGKEGSPNGEENMNAFDCLTKEITDRIEMEGDGQSHVNGLDTSTNKKGEPRNSVRKGRATRSSSSVVKSSPKEPVRKTARNAKKRKVRKEKEGSEGRCRELEQESSEPSLQDAGLLVAKDGIGSRRNLRKATGRKPVSKNKGNRLSYRTRRSRKGKSVDSDELGGDSMESSANDGSVAIKRSTRVRRMPDFYSSLDSTSLSASMNRKNHGTVSVEKTDVVSGRKNQRKAKKNPGIKSNELKPEVPPEKTEEIVEKDLHLEITNSGNKSDEKEIFEDGRDLSLRKGGNMNVCCQENCPKKTDGLNDSIRNLISKEQRSQDPEGNSDEKAMEVAKSSQPGTITKAINIKRERQSIISTAPSLVIIEEMEESSETLEKTSPKSTSSMVGDEKRTGESKSEKPLQKCKKRKGQTRKGRSSMRNREGNECLSDAASVAEKSTGVSKGGDDSADHGIIQAVGGGITEDSGVVETGKPVENNHDVKNDTIRTNNIVDQESCHGEKVLKTGDKGPKSKRLRGRGGSAAKLGLTPKTDTREGSISKGRRANEKVVVANEVEQTTAVNDSERVVDGEREAQFSHQPLADRCTDAIKQAISYETGTEKNGTLQKLETPQLRRSARKAKKNENKDGEKENIFAVPQAKSPVKRKPLSKRNITTEENGVPAKKSRVLLNKKNMSLMSVNFSVIQDTTMMNATKNTTMNSNSVVMPQTLSNFLQSFVAPKIKKNNS